MVIYLIVSADKYELPLDFGNAAELSQRYNISQSTIYSRACRYDQGTDSGKTVGYKIVKVEVD